MHSRKPAKSVLRFAVLAADTALVTIRDDALWVRLIDVHRPPHFNHIPGLPGGLLRPDETAEEAAERHLAAKAGIRGGRAHIEQFHTFSAVDRDPRSRVVAVAHLALVPWSRLTGAEQADSKNAFWRRAFTVGRLAYDHTDIMRAALRHLASRIRHTTVIAKLMPDEFTLTELERAYESILGKDLDKRNFRKKILKLRIVAALPKKRRGGTFRPAQLYRFMHSDVRDIEIL